MHLAGQHKLGAPLSQALQEYPDAQVQELARTLRYAFATDVHADLRDDFPDLPPQPELWEMLGVPPMSHLLGLYLMPRLWMEVIIPEMHRYLQSKYRSFDRWSIWPDSPLSKPDLANEVRKYVKLTPAGQDFRGLCPFHQERTPSFHLWPKSQRWRCFGACATGGDVVDFLKRIKERAQ
jgi:hypothetical protein